MSIPHKLLDFLVMTIITLNVIPWYSREQVQWDNPDNNYA